jgi:tripartite motif-containing protein 24
MASGNALDVNFLSDERIDKICIMCQQKDNNSEAEKFCIDCQDYYCLKCVKVHEKVPYLSDHEILDKDQFLSSWSAYIPMAPTEQCGIHKHKHVDMYCENHDVVGCSTCMTLDHG